MSSGASVLSQMTFYSFMGECILLLCISHALYAFIHWWVLKKILALMNDAVKNKGAQIIFCNVFVLMLLQPMMGVLDHTVMSI